MKNRLAVIPARAGSERIPDKNWQTVGGISLVIHAAWAAQNARIDTIAISSDAALNTIHLTDAQALYAIRRPDEISGPTADIKDAIRHGLIAAEGALGIRYDEVLTLQPTLPIRPPDLIPQMLGAKQATGARSALTVMPCVPWMWRVEGEQATNDWHPGPYPRSQDVRHGYFQEINSVTIADRDVVLAGKRWDLPLLLCELPLWAYVDIDWPEDLEEARAIWPFVKDREIGELKTHLITEINACPGPVAGVSSAPPLTINGPGLLPASLNVYPAAPGEAANSKPTSSRTSTTPVSADDADYADAQHITLKRKEGTPMRVFEISLETSVYVKDISTVISHLELFAKEGTTGDSFEVTMGEMTQAEYEALPELTG